MNIILQAMSVWAQPSPSSHCGPLKENIRCCVHSAIEDWNFLSPKADLSRKISFSRSFAFKTLYHFSFQMCVHM